MTLLYNIKVSQILRQILMIKAAFLEEKNAEWKIANLPQFAIFNSAFSKICSIAFFNSRSFD